MRYYDLDAANARLGELRPLLKGLREDRGAIVVEQARIDELHSGNGDAARAVERARREQTIREIVHRMRGAVARIDGWGISLRDIGSGLVDFPALVNGRPVWLCWRLGEDAVTFWHRQDEVFASRRPIAELPFADEGPVA
jgi:hypothetical protein